MRPSPVPTPPGPTPIETSRLTLRAPDSSDLDALVTGLDDPAVARMLSRVPHPYGPAEAEAFLALASSGNAGGQCLFLAIDLNGTLIGGIGLHGLPEVEDFGYWLARPYWGKGYASEAAAAVLGHAFQTLGVDRVLSGAFVDNPGSLRVQDKLGFERVGTSMRYSRARGATVEHVDTVLTRARFAELAQ